MAIHCSPNTSSALPLRMSESPLLFVIYAPGSNPRAGPRQSEVASVQNCILRSSDSNDLAAPKGSRQRRRLKYNQGSTFVKRM